MNPFEQAFKWYTATAGTRDPTICETRDLFQARLDSMYREIATQTAREASLLTAVSGEIGNNCFDHNLGQWQDIAGCWFQHGMERDTVWILIADRGQGVLSSLKRVAPTLENDQEALEAAFLRQISGRSPEQRGNGLKFVRSVINGNDRRGLFFASGSGSVTYGGLSREASRAIVSEGLKPGRGTFSLIMWGMP